MKNLWPLVLIVIAVFAWNKSCRQSVQEAWLQHTGTRTAESLPGGPVRQLAHEPADMMERERALPQPGGLSAGAMVDSVRQGLQRQDAN